MVAGQLTREEIAKAETDRVPQVAGWAALLSIRLSDPADAGEPGAVGLPKLIRLSGGSAAPAAPKSATARFEASRHRSVAPNQASLLSTSSSRKCAVTVAPPIVLTGHKRTTAMQRSTSMINRLKKLGIVQWLGYRETLRKIAPGFLVIAFG